MANEQGKSTEEIEREMKQEAAAAKRDVAASARERAETGKKQSARQLDKVSEAVDQAASSLSEQDVEGLASFARQTSDKISDLATRLQNRSMDELTEDAKRLAREKPAAFMLGSVAAGFGLSRFLKATEAKSYDGDHRAGAADTLPYTSEPPPQTTSASPTSGN
ncbi:MAG: hypothetical protein WDZ76_08700 [Pseudohongiellaceae bacterium]